MLVYGAVHYYIYRRGRQSLPENRTVRRVYTTIFILLFLASLFGRIGYRYFYSKPVEVVHWIGSFWSGMVLYFFIIVLIIDLLRLVGRFVKVNSVRFRFVSGIKGFSITVLVVTILVIYGSINAKTIRVTEVPLTIDKEAGPLSSLHLVAVADLHLEGLVTPRRLRYVVREINSLKPDIVLLLGDTVSTVGGSFEGKKLGEILSRIRSRYGVYAVTGNHEFFGDIDAIVEHLSRYGIRFLRDEVVLVEGIYLIGREDRHFNRFSTVKRKTLVELLSGVNAEYPVILMDHQPFHLSEAAEQGVDLQVSGHTHGGQIFPINLIVKLVYELSWGYMKKGNTHFYVTSGAGTVGPPLRIGTISEIVDITLKFK
jgi:predicted MPP superfamily phosphohydrolase